MNRIHILNLPEFHFFVESVGGNAWYKDFFFISKSIFKDCFYLNLASERHKSENSLSFNEKRIVNDLVIYTLRSRFSLYLTEGIALCKNLCSYLFFGYFWFSVISHISSGACSPELFKYIPYKRRKIE